MAIGKSHRIVIEVDPEFKEELYAALHAKGLTLKGWFVETAKAELLSLTRSENHNNKDNG